MDIKRINELATIIDDAQKKMNIIESRLLDKDNTQDVDYLLDMFYMNMDRKSLCMEEITKISGKARI